MIRKEIVAQTIEALESYIDTLDDDTKAAQVQTLLNFWRLYDQFSVEEDAND